MVNRGYKTKTQKEARAKVVTWMKIKGHVVTRVQQLFSQWLRLAWRKGGEGIQEQEEGAKAHGKSLGKK